MKRTSLREVIHPFLCGRLSRSVRHFWLKSFEVNRFEWFWSVMHSESDFLIELPSFVIVVTSTDSQIEPSVRCSSLRNLQMKFNKFIFPKMFSFEFWNFIKFYEKISGDPKLRQSKWSSPHTGSRSNSSRLSKYFRTLKQGNFSKLI